MGSRRWEDLGGGRAVCASLTSLLCAQAKLRGRNRSAEEGVLLGDSKAAPPKDPHVQRSKSCKIPGLSGKPLALPPKPEKSSG